MARPAPARDDCRGSGGHAGRRARRVAAALALPAGVLAVAAVLLYIPAAWREDLRPFPDALEYALTARGLARFEPYRLTLLGRSYPPRYPFGFPLLLAPAYRLPGATFGNGIYGVALTYALGRRAGGRVAGLVAAATLLLLPQYPA